MGDPSRPCHGGRPSALGRFQPPPVRKGEHLRWVSAGQSRPTFSPRHSPSHSPGHPRTGLHVAATTWRSGVATERRSVTPEVAAVELDVLVTDVVDARHTHSVDRGSEDRISSAAQFRSPAAAPRCGRPTNGPFTTTNRGTFGVSARLSHPRAAGYGTRRRVESVTTLVTTSTPSRGFQYVQNTPQFAGLGRPENPSTPGDSGLWAWSATSWVGTGPRLVPLIAQLTCAEKRRRLPYE